MGLGRVQLERRNPGQPNVPEIAPIVPEDQPDP